MTVLDTSAVVDYLLGGDAHERVGEVLGQGPPAAAPDLLVFEVLSALRGAARRGDLDPERAKGALADLRDAAIDLFPSPPLVERAWELRDNVSAADALFVALAESLGEPLVTLDRGLVAAARGRSAAEILLA